MSQSTTREKLLDAATKLFHRLGYAAVSLQLIAESVGLKQGNVYYHFRTKRSLGLAVLERWAEINRTGLVSLEAKRPPRSQILAYLEWSPEQARVYSRHGCPIANLTAELLADSDGDARKELPSIHVDTIEWLSSRFNALGLPRRRSERAASFVWSVAQGAISQSRVTGTPTAARVARGELAVWLDSLAEARDT